MPFPLFDRVFDQLGLLRPAHPGVTALPADQGMQRHRNAADVGCGVNVLRQQRAVVDRAVVGDDHHAGDQIDLHAVDLIFLKDMRRKIGMPLLGRHRPEGTQHSGGPGRVRLGDQQIDVVKGIDDAAQKEHCRGADGVDDARAVQFFRDERQNAQLMIQFHIQSFTALVARKHGIFSSCRRPEPFVSS